MAHEITAAVPSHDHTGEIAAVYQWLLTYIPFRKDTAQKELIESPVKVIEKVRSGKSVGIDCDDYLVLAGSLLQALGHPIRFAIEGTVQPGIYEHIHLEVFDESAGQWYAFDPSLSNAPLGTPMQGLVSRWVESSKQGPVGYPPPVGTIDAELGDTHPCAIGLAPDDYPPGAIVHVGNRRWVRDGAKKSGARYWRFAGQLEQGGEMKPTNLSLEIIDSPAARAEATSSTLGAVTTKQGTLEVLESVLSTGREPAGRQPAGMESRSIDYSNQNQELYILLTQPDADPRRLRRLFGFKRPPLEREKWWRHFWREADFQEALPIETQVTLGKDYIKVPMPGFVDGNTASGILTYFVQFAPSEIPPGGRGPGEDSGPGWADLVPDPDSFFGKDFKQGLWTELAASMLMNNMTLQSLIDVGYVLTGQDLAPGLNNTDAAKSIIVSSDLLLNEARNLTQGTLGEGATLAIIIAILSAIATAITAVGKAISKIIEAAKQVAEPVVGAINEVKTQSEEMGRDAAAAAHKANEIQDAMRGYADDPIGDAEQWLENFRDGQIEAMNLSIARDALDRFYKLISQYGFSAAQASEFRTLINELASRGPMFYLISKERVLREMRELKIASLNGVANARESFDLMLHDMRAAGGLIKLWAEEYAALPFDAGHIEIPGAPDPNPPGELPEGNYPYTDADEPPENPFLDEQELGDRFDQEVTASTQPGYDWAGAASKQWSGERVSVSPGISVDVAPGAGGKNEVTILDEEGGIFDVSKRDQGFAAEHPIVAATAIGGVGWGLWKLYQAYKVVK